MDSTTSPTTQPLYRGTQIVWYVLGVLEVLMGFRFVLKLLGANPGAGFTDFIYTLSSPLVSPFLNVFRVTQVVGSVFEWTTLLAMAVYALVAWGVINMFVMGRTVSTPEAAVKLKAQDS